MKTIEYLKSHETYEVQPAPVSIDSRGSVRHFFSRFLNTILIVAAFIIISLVIFTLVVTLPGVMSNSDLSGSSLAANCSVTMESGKFWTKDAESSTWQEGTSGMVLNKGDFIKTDSESRALLTFFEGSTLTVDPGTELQIMQLDKPSQGYTTILVKQFVGRTWSLVEKMVDKRSRYEIQTPSAQAMVRGTSFYIDVNESGETNIEVVEGVVAVNAQGKEVTVSAGEKTFVKNGMAPAGPTQIGAKSPQDYRNNSSGNEPGKSQDMAAGPDRRDDSNNSSRIKSSDEEWTSETWLTFGVLILLLAMLAITFSAIVLANKVEGRKK